MSNLSKNLLSWLVIVLVIVLIVFFWAGTKQKLETAVTTNTISFSGEGKISAKPDVAVLDLSIVIQAPTSKDAQNQNSQKSAKVVNFLKTIGIDDKDIKTANYNIYPQYDYRASAGRPTINGYQVSETLEVKVRDLEKTSAVLDGAVTAGANQVGQLMFKIDDPEKLKSQARAKAIADAKKKAKELESQVGFRLGKIVNFYENSGGYPIFYNEARTTGLGGGPIFSPLPALPSGENEITVEVTLTYQIK